MKPRLLNAIKKLLSITNRQFPVVDSGKIQYDGENLNLIVNGMPSSIVIQYTGVVYFESKMSPLVKVRFNKNAIFIFNLFKQEIPELIFEYSGDLNITNCKIMSFNQSFYSPTIESKIGEDKTNLSETNFEDDDSLLYGTKSRAQKYQMHRGASKPRGPLDKFDEFGTLQKYGQKEISSIKTTVTREITKSTLAKTSLYKKSISKPLISKPSISKPSVSKPTISKPTVSKPTVSKPTVSRPTVSRPTVTAPKIEKKGGKY